MPPSALGQEWDRISILENLRAHAKSSEAFEVIRAAARWRVAVVPKDGGAMTQRGSASGFGSA
jgi:hypothetical protein